MIRIGKALILQTGEMKFNYQEAFSIWSPDAYETLLWDVMKNDATLFMRADQAEAAWRLSTPVLEAWAVFQRLTDLPESRNGRTS
jgi:glucose-6-phosphate 1-dehydrogenase